MPQIAQFPFHENATPAESSLDGLRFFALQGSSQLGSAVSSGLGRALDQHEERTFEDGEHKIRPLAAVSHKDVYVLHGLHSGATESANDKLCRLLFFIGALKDAGAASVTAVVPYLCYARKDRRTKPQDPVTTRYVAQLFESVGTDAVVTLEVHNPAAFENAFRRRTVMLTAAPLFIDYLGSLDMGRICVVSPDPGGVKRAELFREALESVHGHEIGKAFVDKRRSAGTVTGETLVGDVADATAIILDDLISTGNTIARAARAARQAGATGVIAMASHGLFMPGAAGALADPAIDRIVVSDAVPPFRLPPGPARQKLDVLPIAPLLTEAIVRLHTGRPMADLLVL